MLDAIDIMHWRRLIKKFQRYVFEISLLGLLGLDGPIAASYLVETDIA